MQMEKDPTNPLQVIPPVEAPLKESVRNRRRRDKIYQEARRAPSGLYTYLMLSSIALRMSINRERNPRVREVRKDLLTRRWKQLSGDILHTPFPEPM